MPLAVEAAFVCLQVVEVVLSLFQNELQWGPKARPRVTNLS